MALHQDKPFFPQRLADNVPDDRYGFSAMWYVQATPLEMGPTELVRGSQIAPQDYSQDVPDESRLFRQAIPAGSLLLFNHRTWHRGAMNQTDRPRDLITNAYARPEVHKTQLTKTLENGRQEYVLCSDLIGSASDIMKQLLMEPLPSNSLSPS